MLTGSSAVTRHSIACPRKTTSSWRSPSGSPAAISDLRADEVDARDHLGHRMLDLDARVDLEEVEAVLPVEQELDGARALVARGPAETERRGGQLPAGGVRQPRARRLLQKLLVPALDGAVALTQVDDVAAAVGQHLHLDVARAIHVALQVDLGGSERRRRLTLAGPHGSGQAVGVPDDPDPAPTAPQRGLEQDRVAERVGDAPRLRLVAHGAVAPGEERHVRLPRELAGPDLVAEQPDHLRARPDEADAARPADLGERRVLGEEAVPGVNRLGVRDLGGRDQLRDVEVALALSSGPMQMLSSASRTGSDPASAVEWATTDRMPISRHVRRIRSAISPRLAIRIFDEHGLVSSARRRPGGGLRRPRR